MVQYLVMRLKEALDTKPGEVISLVGGGGKTTIMFALAHELAGNGNCVIITTTTKIFEPSSSETQLLLVEKDDEKMIRLLLENMADYRHITLASEKLAASGKLDGIAPELVVRLAELNQVTYVIVEADGAAHRSLKAPNATEPVIPESTSLVIPVVGIDAVGCRLGEEDVFRPEIVSRLLGLALGAVISTEAIASLLTHHEGIIKGSPARARIVPFINKVDLDEGLNRGRDLAGKILARGHPRIRQVILGQAQLPEPVAEVVSG